MKQLVTTRALLAMKLMNVPRNRIISPPAAMFSQSARLRASEADPDDYGHNPDPIEQSWGLERKMLIARLMGDDRYEQKVYYRAVHSTREHPNLVPLHLDEKAVGCLCEADGEHVNYWIIRKGDLKRCECGHWFKAVEAPLDSFC